MLKLKLVLTVLAAAGAAACTSASPSPTAASPAPATRNLSPVPTSWACVTSSPTGVCGPYESATTNSNGHNTYLTNNCWADPSCRQTLSANSFSRWQVVADEPAGNTSVKTAPAAQQLFNDWCAASSTWNTCPSFTDTPISALSQLSSTYAESTPHNSQTIAQFAWDNWLTNDSGHPHEVMVWVDNSNRGSGGATQVAGPVSIHGQNWTLYEYGSGELIWSLGAPGTFAQQRSGRVDLLALLKWLQSHGYATSRASIGEIDGVWEICSTGGIPETFSMASYSITARGA